MAHAEHGFGDMDPVVVQQAIAKGCNREGVAIALIDGPERVEAVIGLHSFKPWWSTDAAANWYWQELLIYVHPLHRRTRHALKLLQFAHWWGEKIKMPVVLNLMPKEGFARKEKLFERSGKKIGGSYLIGNEHALG